MPELQAKDPPRSYSWGRKKTPLKFCCGPESDFHPLGYEPEIVNVLERFIDPGDVVVDAGASIGLHTCLMSKLVGDDGLVLAFEPQVASFSWLMRHVYDVNKLRNVLCLRQALWKEDDDNLKLWNFTDLGYSSVHPYFKAVNFEVVEARQLDTLIVDEENHPKVIKIDCEGAEAEVLLGAQRILNKGVDCVILEINQKLMKATNRDDRIIRGFMKSIGYDMFLINIGDEKTPESYSDPIPVEPNIHIKLEGGFHINVLFSTKEKVKERWKTSVV